MEIVNVARAIAAALIIFIIVHVLYIVWILCSLAYSVFLEKIRERLEYRSKKRIPSSFKI